MEDLPRDPPYRLFEDNNVYAIKGNILTIVNKPITASKFEFNPALFPQLEQKKFKKDG